MNELKPIVAVVILGCLVTLAAPLSFTGCRSLDKTGVYAGDKFLYDSELAIVTSYDLLDAFLKWETSNRAALSTVPEIKKSADNIRKDSKRWFASAHALRDAYAANPTSENRTALQSSLSVIHAAL